MTGCWGPELAEQKGDRVAEASMESAAAFAARAALDAGNAMEAAFSSAKAADREGALDMAKEAAAKAIQAKKALSTVLHKQTSANLEMSRAALGHVEDARLFAKAAMDVTRSAARRATDRAGGAAAKKAAETVAFLMAAASALLDVKRGTAVELSLRKAAAASERAGQAAEDALKAGGAGNPHAEDAKAARGTAAEIARRALWAVREAAK